MRTWKCMAWKYKTKEIWIEVFSVPWEQKKGKRIIPILGIYFPSRIHFGSTKMIVNIVSFRPSQYSHDTGVVNFTMLHPQKVHASFATQLHDVILRTKQGYIMMFFFWPVCGSEPKVHISFHRSTIGRRVSYSSNYLHHLFGDHFSSRNFVMDCKNVVNASMPTALGCSSRVR